MRNQTGSSKIHLLMCRPDHFKVSYEINPWMRITHQPNRKHSIRQWNALYKVLRRETKAQISLLEPLPHCPDLVFTANAGVAVGDEFFLSRFRYPQRGREEPHFKKWFKNNGYKIKTLPQNCFFEGEGDFLFLGNQPFLGFRFRSEAGARPWLEDWLGRRILALELADKRFYHLDTCFLPLNDETLLYYPGAFTPAAQRIIKNYVPNPVPVTIAEALNFVLNGVVIGKTLVANEGCSKKTKAVIRKAGLRLTQVDLSEFHKSGGSAKCLTLYLPARGSAYDHNENEH